MNEKNKGKKAAEYGGELLIVTASDVVYNKFMNACQLFESGGLVNPDTGCLYRDDTEGGPFVGRHVVPYTFKHLRGLGPRALEELADKITGGQTANRAQLDTAKVYLGTKPKILQGVTAKQWCTRKRQKNNIAKELAKAAGVSLWDSRTKDMDQQAWKALKNQCGICRPHIDELIRRAGDSYLQKLTRHSEQPRTEAPVCPKEFVIEVQRTVNRRPVFDESRQTAASCCIPTETGLLGRISPFLELTSADGSSPLVVVKFPEMDGDWAGGILDLRHLPAFVEGIDVGDDGRRPLPYSDFLGRWAAVIPTVPFWLVVAHNLDSENVDKVLAEYFSNFVSFESDYIPAKGEAIFFSKTTLAVTNGVKVHILEAGSLVGRMDWPKVLKTEDKRFQSIATYGEASLQSFDTELRMEVYLRYMRQIGEQRMDCVGGNLFLCLSGGRKAAIAASVCCTF
jgi:hypothetical protein